MLDPARRLVCAQISVCISTQLVSTVAEQVYRTVPANAEDMEKFHSSEYIKFLQNITPDKMVSCVRAPSLCRVKMRS